MAKVYDVQNIAAGLASLVEYGPEHEPYNADYSDADRRHVRDWLDGLPAGASVHVTDKAAGFGLCDVSGLYAERVVVVVLVPDDSPTAPNTAPDY